MNKTNQKQVLKLMQSCLELNEPKFHVFCAYSPHVEWLEIRAFPGGWKSHSKEKVEFTISTREHIADDMVDAVIGSLSDEKQSYFEHAGDRFAASVEADEYPSFLLNKELPAFLRRQAR